MAASQNPLPASRFADVCARSGPPPVCVVAGAERWFREDVLAQIVAAILPDGDPGGGYLRYDAKRSEDREGISSSVDDLHSAGLFGGGKVIAIDTPESATGPWAKGGRASPITRLAKAALNPPVEGSAFVLLTSKGVKGREAAPTKTLVTAGALVVDCRALYDGPGPWARGAPAHDHELSRHVVRRMERVHQKRLSLVDAHALTRMVGSDLADLEDALRTLSLYVGGKKDVLAEDLQAAIGTTRTDPVWHLVDAIFDREKERALDLLEQALCRGLPATKGGAALRGPEALFGYLTAALHGQYRKILKGAEALRMGEEPAAVARQAGVPPFLADGYLARCHRDPARFLERHAAFFEAEMGVKSGKVPAGLALERLVLALLA